MIKEVYEIELENDLPQKGVLLTRSDNPAHVPQVDSLRGKDGTKFVDASDIMMSVVRLPFRFPKLFIPLILVGLAEILFFYVFFVVSGIDIGPLLQQGFIRSTTFLMFVLFILTLFVVITASIILEMIQEWENRQTMSYFRALSNTLLVNLPGIVQISISIVVNTIVIGIISAVTRGFFRPGGASDVVIDGGERLANAYVRMRAFLILPAIAWENLSYSEARDRADQAFRVVKYSFIEGFAMQVLIVILLQIPLVALGYFIDLGLVPFSPYLLFIVMAYFFFIPLYSLIMQILFSANIYHWYLQYLEKQKTLSPEQARDLDIEDVPMVKLLEKPKQV